MQTLFPEDEITFDLIDAQVSYVPSFIGFEEANELFNKLINDINWQQDDIVVFGKKFQQPRLTALYGNDGKSYSYSSLTMFPNKWNSLLIYIKEKVEEFMNVKFTTVLLNYYRDGNDSNGWHADNEKELGKNPIIASISFGAKRVFQMRHNTNKDQKFKIELEHGSLLIMKGTTQHFWKHQIPKSTKKVGARINLTFRIIN
ncbi:alpha-ketoglutarate-dependent dioxygenase AlkB [Flavobacterium sp.]|uniref:alpha-ketoglutarate-dependent dioxygenase AlkB family protein n=1 Tax=Flavobacterium sp. TaxID=239 RepID=UPI0035B3E7AD